MHSTITRTKAGPNPVGRTQRARESLGREHYERMRRGMAPVWQLPPWEALGEGTREDHRARLDWLLPGVLNLLDAEDAR